MTKKAFLTLVMLFGVALHFSQAQYDKGKHFGLVGFSLSGNVSSAHTVSSTMSTNDTRTNYHSLSLNYKRGHFVKDNLAQGWIASYGLLANFEEANSLTHLLQAGYFVDKFFPLSKSFYCYGELQGLVGEQFTIRNGGGGNTNVISLKTALNVGVRYHLTNKLFINGETNLAQFELSNSNFPNANATIFNAKLTGGMSVSTVSLSIGKTF